MTSLMLDSSNAQFPPPAQPRFSHTDSDRSAMHLQVIEALATELGRSASEIKPIYDEVLADMKESAKVADFLPILVPKRIKNLFTSDAGKR